MAPTPKTNNTITKILEDNERLKNELIEMKKKLDAKEEYVNELEITIDRLIHECFMYRLKNDLIEMKKKLDAKEDSEEDSDEDSEEDSDEDSDEEEDSEEDSDEDSDEDSEEDSDEDEEERVENKKYIAMNCCIKGNNLKKGGSFMINEDQFKYLYGDYYSNEFINKITEDSFFTIRTWFEDKEYEMSVDADMYWNIEETDMIDAEKFIIECNKIKYYSYNTSSTIAMMLSCIGHNEEEEDSDEE
jgi:hypothetical protein